VIRVYDDAGNMIDTHEHAGDFQRTVDLGSLVRRVGIAEKSTSRPPAKVTRATKTDPRFSPDGGVKGLRLVGGRRGWLRSC
jgi:hypothetical protein